MLESFCFPVFYQRFQPIHFYFVLRFILLFCFDFSSFICELTLILSDTLTVANFVLSNFAPHELHTILSREFSSPQLGQTRTCDFIESASSKFFEQKRKDLSQTHKLDKI